jgi:aspartyl-tRNA(Asn)/glutamyl-tRNA(Gln) amidotransferase subunit A
VQEGSALAAIGTDTGGSVRTPAALCGLAGYRASLGLGDWRGGWHLAESFDTIGWLFRDLRDGGRLAEALFDLPEDARPLKNLRVGVLSGVLIGDCDEAVRGAMAEWEGRLAGAGATIRAIAPEWWRGAWDIYAPIQAREAARIHAGYYDRFAPPIAARLEWGASLSDETIAGFRQQHADYRANLQALFAEVDFVVAPATPVSRLVAGADHTEARALILRHTTPGSLGGNPALVLPSPACGVQLMAAHGDDRRLLRFGERLGDLLASERT